VILYSAS